MYIQVLQEYERFEVINLISFKFKDLWVDE